MFITSITAEKTHGVFAIDVPPPAQIVPVGTGRVALVGQFPWGPDGERVEISQGEAKALFAPFGMNRLASGYLALLGKAFADLVIVRVLGTGAAKATATLADSPTNLMTVTAKYNGLAGNSLVATVADASDGDANHFDLNVTVSGASGARTEKIANINISGTGADSFPTASIDFESFVFIGSLAKLAAGRPDNGTYVLSGGADGTIDAAAYSGTAQTGDRGIALLEGDKAIRHVVVDDCGGGLRAAVNAALKAHVALMGDRVAYINGNSAVSSAASVRSDAATYSSTNVVYADPWVYIFDDTTGSQQLVPSAPFLASVASQLPPSTSIAWKSDVAQQMLGGIVRLEYDRGAGAGSNTEAGVATLIREETGGFTIEAGVVTIAPANPAKRHLTRTLMGIYIVASLRRSLRPYIDAPNVRATWDQIYPPIMAFLDGLKRNSESDAVALVPHIVGYGLGTPESANTRAEIKAGDLKVPIQVELSSGIERLVFLIQYGQTVSITLAN